MGAQAQQQIRSSFSDAELALIDQYRGGLQVGVWLRNEIREYLARPNAAAVPASHQGQRRRVAVNLTPPEKARVDEARGSTPAAQWVRDVILRRLWMRGARW